MNFLYILTVKIIMDKISKRSKGYAFVEYTTVEAANTALKEMNGKVILEQSDLFYFHQIFSANRNYYFIDFMVYRSLMAGW